MSNIYLEIASTFHPYWYFIVSTNIGTGEYGLLETKEYYF